MKKTIRAIAIFALLLLASTNGSSAKNNIYGSGIDTNGLMPINVDDTNVSYRFRAEHSGLLESVAFYLVINKPLYTQGDGGHLLVELRTDDGTGNHFPSNEVLASHYIDKPMDGRSYPGSFVPLPGNPSPCTGSSCGAAFPKIPLNAQIEEGKLYHIVFSNTHADSRNNWMSLNLLWADSTPMQPMFDDLDFALLFYDNFHKTWTTNSETLRTPILSVDYVGGNSQGQGYIEAWTNGSVAIAGDNKVRERFTVSGKDRQISKAFVKVQKPAGTNPGDLTFKLQKDDGTIIEEGNVASASISEGRMQWASYSFREKHTLKAGETYALVLEAPPGDSYSTFAIREGGDVGLNGGLFKDGNAYYSDDGGQSWKVIRYSGFDLQFYFELSCPNGNCEEGENCLTCPQDCPICQPQCGNGTADTGENCSSCPADVQCETGQECIEGTCTATECIREPELLGYISQWKRGEISMLTLMQKMKLWSTGTGC